MEKVRRERTLGICGFERVYFEMSWLYIQVKGSSKQMWGGGKEGGEKEGRGQCIDGRVSP